MRTIHHFPSRPGSSDHPTILLQGNSSLSVDQAQEQRIRKIYWDVAAASRNQIKHRPS